jgi:hypothetical protein
MNMMRKRQKRRARKEEDSREERIVKCQQYLPSWTSEQMAAGIRQPGNQLKQHSS